VLGGSSLRASRGYDCSYFDGGQLEVFDMDTHWLGAFNNSLCTVHTIYLYKFHSSRAMESIKKHREVSPNQGLEKGWKSSCWVASKRRDQRNPKQDRATKSPSQPGTPK
jgi:hypothetical protein